MPNLCMNFYLKFTAKKTINFLSSTDTNLLTISRCTLPIFYILILLLKNIKYMINRFLIITEKQKLQAKQNSNPKARMSKLTQQNLQKALKDNKSYSGAQPFITAMSTGSQQAIQIINTVFVQILCSDKVNLMSKLLVLRMLKDIFITGNLDAFDKIDPQIEQILISAAAYNPKFRSKGKNDKDTRGGMYFVDTQKRTKNTQTLQLGNSFVLLATQMIKNFAQWVPEAADHQPSRFLQTKRELAALGVVFDSNIYFQPDDEKKFKKNFEKWLKSQEKPQQKQKIQPKKDAPNKQKEQKQTQQKINLEEIQRIKQDNDKLENTIKQKNNSIYQLQQQLANQKQKFQTQKQQMRKQISILKQCIEKQTEKYSALQKKLENLAVKENQHEIKKLTQQKLTVENELKRINQIKNDALQRNLNLEIEVQGLKTECDKLRKDLQDKKTEYQRSLAQKNSDSSQIQQTQIKKLQGLKQEYQKQIKRIQNLLNQSQKLNRNYVEQIEILKQRTSKFQSENQELKENIQKLKIKCQAQKLKPTEKSLQKPFVQSIKIVKQEIVQDKIKERVTQKYATSNSFYTPFHEISNLGEMSNTGFAFQNRRSSNSLHKTESSKFKQNKQFENQGILNKSYTLFKKTETNFVQKKSNNLNIKSKNVITSVFPFLPEYFPQLFSQSQNFGACCLLSQKKYSTFFRNELMQLRLIKSKQNPRVFQVGIKNKTFDALTLQVTIEPNQIRIRQQASFIKIDSLNEIKLTLDTFVTDLNFRVPILNVVAQSKERKRKSYKVPVPITLLSFTQLTQSLKILERFDRFNQSCYKKHRSDRVTISYQIHNLMEGFPQLIFNRSSDGGYEASAIMTYSCIPEVELKLNLKSNERCCEFETQFLAESKISEAFSKVILQVLIFILR